MGLKLDILDFKEGGLRLSDFSAMYENRRIALNNKTAAQLAASTALVTNPDPEEFERIKQELLDPESRQQFILRQEGIRRQIWEDSKPYLGSVISDPEIEDGIKTTVLNNTVADRMGGFFSTLGTLAEQGAIADIPEESDEAAEARFNALDTINEVVDYKRMATAAINAMNIGKNPNFLKKAKDFGELILPFAEWAHIAVLSKDIKGDSDSTFLGDKKRELIDFFNNKTLAEKKALIQFVLDTYEQNEDVVLPDGNDIAALTFLEDMLVTDDYSVGEQFMDNMASILDVIGAGVAVRALRGARTARAVRGLEREAAAFKPEALPTDKALEAEAQGFKATPEPTDQALADEAAGFQPETLPTDEALAGEAQAFKPSTEPNIDDVFAEARTESVRTEVVPSSPSQIVKDVNPEQAREMHMLADKDTSGRAAEALYGTSREEALAKDILPEPARADGSVPNKVEMRRPSNEEPLRLKRERSESGHLIVSRPELNNVFSKVARSFEEVEGMVLHTSSLVYKTLDNGNLNITARYSPLDNGFKTPGEAIEAAKFAFRNYRLSDEHFKLLARQGDRWVETTAADEAAKVKLRTAGARGKKVKPTDYAIGIDYEYRFRPEDLDIVDNLTTGGSILSRAIQSLDRMPTQALAKVGQGSVVQHLLDPSSVIHPQIVSAFTVATDKIFGYRKLFVDEFQKFTDEYTKLKPDRRVMMREYINEANFEGLKFDTVDLLNRGFSMKEIEAIKQWRRANDAMWYATNHDLNRTLSARGYKVLVHEGTGTKLLGKPVQKGAINTQTLVYDPLMEGVVTLNKSEIDAAYMMDGGIIEFSQPIQIDGKWVGYAVGRNSPETGYLRAIGDEEIVLNYRDGYYPVAYDANYFIERKITKPDGTEDWVAVASARDTKDSQFLISRLNQTDPDVVYRSRKDRRFGQNMRELDETVWNTYMSAGLTSQRLRGKGLIDAGADLHKIGRTNLKDPLEAVNQQINRLSSKMALRPTLEGAKKRWMLQYGPSLDLPRNPRSGQIEFPRSVGDIKAKNGISNKIAAEARTNFNYIYSMENGFINLIDEGYKAVMHYFADFAAELGVSKAERAALNLSTTSPSSALKSAIFKMTIGASPLRQGIIQRGQLSQLAVMNPKYMSSLPKDLWGLDMVRAGLSKDPKYVKLLREVEDSGILEAVDAHTFINNKAMRMADITAGQKLRTALNKPLEISEKYGFDAAEQDVLLSAYLAFRDKAIREGKNLKDIRVREELLAQARVFMGNMNRSGEMAYSQNTLSLVSQFFSFRHKMLLQPFTNRSLKAKDKAKLLALNTALFGIDATLIGYAVDQIFMDDGAPSEMKDQVRDGLVDTTLNYILSKITGEQQSVDFGDLAPIQAYGTGALIFDMIGTPIGEGLANSPSGSLFFGNNPRLTEAFSTAMRYFHVYDDYDDPELDTKFSDVVRSAMYSFSGMSSAFKARYAYRSGQKLSSYGRVSDSDVSAVEAAATIFGFQTKTETGYRRVKEILYGGRTFEDDDVIQWYADLKRQLSRKGTSPIEDDMSRRIFAEAWRVFGEERPRAVEVIQKELEKDAANGDYIMYQSIIRKIGLFTDKEMWEMINQLPPGNVRDRVTQLMNAREEIKNGED